MRRYFDAFAGRTSDELDKILAPGFFVRGLHQTEAEIPAEAHGPAAFKALLEDQNSGGMFGNTHLTLDEMVADESQVMVRWSVRGTHTAEFAGIAPTSKPVEWSGVNYFRIENGKLAEAWDLWDRLLTWQQLGVLSPTQEFLEAARKRLNSTSR
ncbi:MAG: ester cyclase [Anaerolineales bacterium]